MVKVFLEESAELCRTRLDTLIKDENSYRILCPSESFIKKLVTFYPHLTTANLITFSQLISEWGYTPVPAEIANILSRPNPFLDTTLRWLEQAETLEKSERDFLENWLKEAGFWTFGSTSKPVTKPCKMCIYFGSFEPTLLNKLQEYLSSFFETMVVIRRIFKFEQKIQFSQIKSYEVRNVQQEREYVRNISKQNTHIIACHVENWLELFQSQSDIQRLRWLDYQENATLGYLLSYLYTSHVDKTSRDADIKKLQNAQKQCTRDDLCSVSNWLSLQGEAEDLPFTFLNWPLEGTLGDFVQLLSHSQITWNLPKSLEHCPIKFTCRQFFAFLRKNVKHYAYECIIPWEDAPYFPIKNGCFLHGVSEYSHFDGQRLSWLKDLENRGGNLMVITPALDEKNMPYTPLIAPNAKTEETTQKIDVSEFPNQFILPKERLKLSCKNWERFRLNPIRTWLDVILKVKKFDLIQPNIQARICGEWVHENLEFEKQPKDLIDWQSSIAQKAEKRWKKFKALFDEKIPVQLQQWHTQTYRLSLRIAQACNDLLDGSWTLHSEYVLPKSAEHSGRIDLLATRFNQAVIIDFKTATNYAFTVAQVNNGHGLQLLLYGRALEPYYGNIQLRVINGNCDNLILDLNEISDTVESIEAWLKDTQASGVYMNLPKEEPSVLPLCWR